MNRVIYCIKRVNYLDLNYFAVHQFGIQKPSCLGFTMLQRKAVALNGFEVVFQHMFQVNKFFVYACVYFQIFKYQPNPVHFFAIGSDNILDNKIP